ncbi:MAG: heme o synthase [Planctomycetales bacterium]|nr:heme o synthase [Planctomycetales bacterium]
MEASKVAPNTSIAPPSVAVIQQGIGRRIAFYIELTKPRILVMILITVVIGMVSAGSAVGLLAVIHACVGTSLVAASASTLNQWLERERDAVMKRTCRRPIPSGRVASSQAAWMGWVLGIVGSAYLGLMVNVPTMLCGLATWGLYVWVYTPLKMVSWTNTLVGTLPGALPVWMGWTAAGGSLFDGLAWVLLGVVVAWQLPHFMAIAYMYREQYESAGYKMITVTDPSGRGAGWHAILGSMALIVLSVFAVPPTSFIGGVLTILALSVAAWMAMASIRFVRQPTHATARRMLHVSLLHLPLTMLLILLSHWLA